jgi:GDP-L-fucose synthase
MPDVPYLNLGSGTGTTIKELLETLNEIVEFNYEWDTTKSNGFPKRIMDISLARKLIDYNPQISLINGLASTWSWYVNNKEEYLKRQNYFKEV